MNIYRSIKLHSGNCAAATLVEVMVSVVIFGLVFGAVASVLTQGYMIMETARDNTRVSQVLQSEIERLRSMSWADLDGLPSPQQYVPQSGFNVAFNNRYQCTRVINARKPDQKEIILTVIWDDSKSINHVRQFVTYYTKEGLNDYFYRSF